MRPMPVLPITRTRGATTVPNHVTWWRLELRSVYVGDCYGRPRPPLSPAVCTRDR